MKGPPQKVPQPAAEITTLTQREPSNDSPRKNRRNVGSWRRQHRHQYRRQPSPRHQNRGEPGPRRLWVKAADPHLRSRWAACPRHQRGCTTRTTSVPAKASMGNNWTWSPAQEPRRQRPAARQPRQRQRQPKTSEQRLPHWRLPLHWPLLLPLPLRSTSNAAVPRGREEWTPEACATMAVVAQQPWAMWPAAARAPRRAADRMDPAAMPRSSKAVRKAVRHALGDAQDCTMNDRT